MFSGTLASNWYIRDTNERDCGDNSKLVLVCSLKNFSLGWEKTISPNLEPIVSILKFDEDYHPHIYGPIAGAGLADGSAPVRDGSQ